MACTSIKFAEIGTGCRNFTGGIKDIWIIKREDIESVTFSETELGEKYNITGITTATDTPESGDPVARTFSHWKFVRETGNATTTATVNNESGTIFFQTDLALQFLGIESVKRAQIMAATIEETVVVYRDSNNRLFYLGIDYPVTASAAGANTGTALGDSNIYTITLTDLSKSLPYQIHMDSASLDAIGIVLGNEYNPD